jgi:hypothetical protein
MLSSSAGISLALNVSRSSIVWVISRVGLMFFKILSQPKSFPVVLNFWLRNANELLLKLFFASTTGMASISLASSCSSIAVVMYSMQNFLP